MSDTGEMSGALILAKALVKASEGCRLVAYQDSVGVWTIGYGHTGAGVHAGLIITQEQAEGLLEADLAIAQSGAVSLSPTLSTTVHKQAAIIDFIFNLGAHRYEHSTLRALIDTGHWGAVPAELMKWVWAGGKVLPGLTKRRTAEGNLWQLPD